MTKLHAMQGPYRACGSQPPRVGALPSHFLLSVRDFVDALQRKDPNLCRRCARSRAVQDALSYRRERRLNPEPREAT